MNLLNKLAITVSNVKAEKDKQINQILILIKYLDLAGEVVDNYVVFGFSDHCDEKFKTHEREGQRCKKIFTRTLWSWTAKCNRKNIVDFLPGRA